MSDISTPMLDARLCRRQPTVDSAMDATALAGSVAQRTSRSTPSSRLRRASSRPRRMCCHRYGLAPAQTCDRLGFAAPRLRRATSRTLRLRRSQLPIIVPPPRQQATVAPPLRRGSAAPSPPALPSSPLALLASPPTLPLPPLALPVSPLLPLSLRWCHPAINNSARGTRERVGVA